MHDLKWYEYKSLTHCSLFLKNSLLALTSVIQALSLPGNQKPRHINYRDSKLTRILQPHLSGNAEMAILCCASRSKTSVEETRSTLKFASRAKLIQMKPKINEVIDDSAIIRNLQAQLIEVRKQLELAESKLEEGQSHKAAATKLSVTYSDIIAHKNNQDAVYSDIIADKQPTKLVRDDENDALDFTNSSEASTANLSSEYDKSFEQKEHMSPSREKIVEETPHELESVDSPVSSDFDSFRDHEEPSPDISLKVCSQLSHADTIREVDGEDDKDTSVFRSLDAGFSAPNGRLDKNLSSDSTALSTDSPAQNGKPLLQIIENLNDKGNDVIPDQIAIIDASTSTGNNMCLMDQLREYEARIHFLEEQLELSDNIIEANSRDLQRARDCIRDLVQKNGEMNGSMTAKRKQDAKKYYEVGEVMIEQHLLLRSAIYCSLFFFLTGSHEYFLASAFFIWLTLETNLSA